MLNKKITLITLSIFCSFAFLIPSLSSIAAEKQDIKFGVFPFSPVNFLDEKGKPSGIYIDIIEAIARKEGWRIIYVPGTWDEGLNRIKHGEIDLMPSIAYSEERDKFVDFNHESVVTVWGEVYVRPNSGVQNILDLNGQTIAVMKGDISAANFKEKIRQFNIKCTFIECPSHYEVLKHVEQKEAFGGVVPNIFGLMNFKKYDVVKSSIIFSPFTIYFGAPEGNKTLISVIDLYLKEWKTDKNSFYYETLNRWLAGEQFEKRVIPRWLIISIFITIAIALLLIIWVKSLRYQVQKQTRELLGSREKYLQLFESMMDAYASVDMDRNIVDTNNAFNQMIGYTSEELKKLNAKDITPEKWHTFEQNIIKDQVLKNGYSELFEKEYIRKDGTIFPAELRIFLLRDDNGEPTGMWAIIRDITERKQADSILRHSEEQLRLFIQQTPAAVAMFDRDMCYIAASSRWISAYHLSISNTEIIGLSHYEVFPEIPEHLKEIHKKGMNGEILKADEESFERMDGTIQWIKWEVRPWYRTDDNVGGIIILSEDITDLKQAEEKRLDLEKRLTQAQKMESIGTLAGGIAHDFNNILSPIILHAEMMMDDLPPDDPLQHDIKEIYKAGTRARDLVQQILTFARKKTEEKIVLRASQIVKEAIKFLRSTIPTTIDIQYHFEAEQDTVLADPTQLNQIVMNLCTNAAHAMKEKGGLLKINLDNEYVATERLDGAFRLIPGKYLRLSVRDSGTGISHENMTRIFEPYFTTKGPGEGTGLGLAIIHGIIQNSGGAIHVESKIGEGTIFRVYLPLVEDFKPLTYEKDAEIPIGTERILMVDDEEAIIKITNTMLTRLGYKVMAKTDSMEVLEIFRTSPESFDLLITDMTMPNMTGKTLASEIKKIRPDIPIILCTGFNDQIDDKRTKEMGIDALIMKPIIKSQMAITIREVLDKNKT